MGSTIGRAQGYSTAWGSSISSLFNAFLAGVGAGRFVETANREGGFRRCDMDEQGL